MCVFHGVKLKRVVLLPPPYLFGHREQLGWKEMSQRPAITNRWLIPTWGGGQSIFTSMACGVDSLLLGMCSVSMPSLYLADISSALHASGSMKDRSNDP